MMPCMLLNRADMPTGSPITRGNRYVLAGFVDTLDPLSYESFMQLYDPM